jgi:hypothetical protein
MIRLGPCTNIEYLGLTIDSDELLVKIPQDKIEKLQDQLTSVLDFISIFAIKADFPNLLTILTALSKGEYVSFVYNISM